MKMGKKENKTGRGEGEETNVNKVSLGLRKLSENPTFLNLCYLL